MLLFSIVKNDGAKVSILGTFASEAEARRVFVSHLKKDGYVTEAFQAQAEQHLSEFSYMETRYDIVEHNYEAD